MIIKRMTFANCLSRPKSENEDHHLYHGILIPGIKIKIAPQTTSVMPTANR